jgi:hypothetical protein
VTFGESLLHSHVTNISGTLRIFFIKRRVLLAENIYIKEPFHAVFDLSCKYELQEVYIQNKFEWNGLKKV